MPPLLPQTETGGAPDPPLCCSWGILSLVFDFIRRISVRLGLGCLHPISSFGRGCCRLCDSDSACLRVIGGFAWSLLTYVITARTVFRVPVSVDVYLTDVDSPHNWPVTRVRLVLLRSRRFQARRGRRVPRPRRDIDLFDLAGGPLLESGHGLNGPCMLDASMRLVIYDVLVCASVDPEPYACAPSLLGLAYALFLRTHFVSAYLPEDKE